MTLLFPLPHPNAVLRTACSSNICVDGRRRGPVLVAPSAITRRCFDGDARGISFPLLLPRSCARSRLLLFGAARWLGSTWLGGQGAAGVAAAAAGRSCANAPGIVFRPCEVPSSLLSSSSRFGPAVPALRSSLDRRLEGSRPERFRNSPRVFASNKGAWLVIR